MSLSVPPVTSRVTEAYAGRHLMRQPSPAQSPSPATLDLTTHLLACQLDVLRQELTFETTSSNPVRVGEWVVVTSAGMLSPPRHISNRIAMLTEQDEILSTTESKISRDSQQSNCPHLSTKQNLLIKLVKLAGAFHQ